MQNIKMIYRYEDDRSYMEKKPFTLITFESTNAEGFDNLVELFSRFALATGFSQSVVDKFIDPYGGIGEDEENEGEYVSALDATPVSLG